MCDDTSPGLRDGIRLQTIPEDITDPQFKQYGQHETYDYYEQCKTRKRNKKLFVADRNLNGDTAIFTRQNNNGQRFGFECPEERDYYPYFHPSPWRDIYVCTDEPTRCGYYTRESQNVVDKGNCTSPEFDNKGDCEANGNIWTLVGAYNIPPPDCGVCPTTRNNHLGQTMDSGDTPNYVWTIPTGVVPDGSMCVLRIRYNISTYDFDGWATDALFNGANSKVKGNPTVDFLGFGGNVSGPLTLNINTAQFGRTFQDRSHAFIIRKAPDVKRNFIGTTRIINLNVRGRRGNIVQVYPSVEYDFVPNKVDAKRGDYLHIQWTGSDANQRGNTGNGRDGTDRNNLVLMASQGVNYPLNMKPDGLDAPKHFTNNMAMVTYLAFLGQTNCSGTPQDANDPLNCGRLNAASGYFNAGLVRMDNTGTFHIVSVRNSAFSNREQKGTITVKEDSVMIAAAFGVTVLGIGALAGLTMGFMAYIRYGRRNPTTRAGAMVAFLNLQGKPVHDAVPTFETGEAIKNTSWWSAKLVKWWTWEGQRFTIVAIYTFINIAVWIYGYVAALGVSPAPYYPYAKGFGKTLNINCSFIILPVLRNLLRYLRSTPLADIVPLDDNLNMHKLVFGYIVIGAGFHAGFHYSDFVWYERTYGISVGSQAWGNLAGATGHLVSICMLLMAVTSLFNRKLVNIFGKRFDGYRTFLLFHKLWIPCFALLWLHGSMFWAFSIWPLALMGLEKLVQTTRAKVDVTIVEAKLVNKDVMSLKMKLQGKRKKFSYKAGEYLFLNCPDIAEEEWHPFTITSAPEEAHFGVHIRCRPDMDWCYRLRLAVGVPGDAKREKEKGNRSPRVSVLKSSETMEEGAGSGSQLLTPTLPRLRVDGPYGSPSEEVFDHSVVVLVGAGIGVTPFISILKSMSLRSSHKLGLKGEVLEEKFRVHFYWICRDDQEFQAFRDLIDAVITSANLKDMLTVNTYTTGELDLKKVKHESYNQYSGKPNWTRILQEIAKTHPGEEVGVFMCGPLPLARELSAACKRHNLKERGEGDGKEVRDGRTFFKFRKENF